LTTEHRGGGDMGQAAGEPYDGLDTPALRTPRSKRGGKHGGLARVLTRRPVFPVRHHPVPDDLGRRKERAEAFARAWSKQVGPTELVFTQRSDEGRRARAEAAAEDGGYETVVRDIWV